MESSTNAIVIIPAQKKSVILENVAVCEKRFPILVLNALGRQRFFFDRRLNQKKGPQLRLTLFVPMAIAVMPELPIGAAALNDFVADAGEL